MLCCIYYHLFHLFHFLQGQLVGGIDINRHVMYQHHMYSDMNLYLLFRYIHLFQYFGSECSGMQLLCTDRLNIQFLYSLVSIIT